MLFQSRATTKTPNRRRTIALRVNRLEDRLQPNAGVLDPTFGTGGQVTAAVTSNAVIVQPWDSKIVIAGSTSGVMALARYNADGTLDGTYDGDGVLVSNVAGSIMAAAQYPQVGNSHDGKIVGANATTLARFNVNGGLDTSFDADGKVTIPWNAQYGGASLVIQPDGKIVASGIDATSGTKIVKVTRFNVSGSIDTSFGTGGTWQYSLGGYLLGNAPPIWKAPISLQDDGKFLVTQPYGVLTTGIGWFVRRLTTNGALDTTYTSTFTSFGSAYLELNGAARPAGLATYPTSDPVNAGKTLAVGFTFQYSGDTPPGGATVLARYNANGTLDSTFGTGGKVITPGGGTPRGVAIQADGKAIIAGTTMQCYNTDGSLDTSFGSGGFVNTLYSGIDIQPDGKIAVTNSTTVARYLAELAPPPPTLISIDDVNVSEGHVGSQIVNFTVALSTAYTEPVTVNFTTANGTGQVGSDYELTAGTLTFEPGETTKLIPVSILGDRLGENNEYFFVNLSNPTNGGLADGQGVATIADDEPRISISDVSMTEGKSGTKSFVFTVSLSAAYDEPVTFSYLTNNGTATTGNNDYIFQSGTLTFAPGQTQLTITIQVVGNTKKEANEEFYVDLSGNSSNALISDGRGVGSIINDD